MIGADALAGRSRAGGPSPADHPFDLAAARQAVHDLLTAFGYRPESEPGLMETPRRVAAALAEMLQPPPFTLTTFPNEGSEDLVVVGGIRFRSLCMHHLLPFVGSAVVAYLPGEHLAGLSKLARVVGTFAGRLQIQERLTAQIADFLDEQLRPRGVGVLLEAEHMCMSLRGVAKPGARTVTSALRGAMREDAALRREFFSTARRPTFESPA